MIKVIVPWLYYEVSTELEFQCFGDSICCFLPVILSVGFLTEIDFWPYIDQYKYRCEQLEFGSCQDVMTATCAKLISEFSDSLWVYMGAMRVKTGVKDGRGLRDCQGQHLHLTEGETEAEQEPDFIPALYSDICFDFLSSIGISSHWQTDIPELGKHRISCIDLGCVTWFLGVLLLLSVKWKSNSTDSAVVMMSDNIPLCCSMQRNVIVSIISSPHHSPRRQAQLFSFYRFYFLTSSWYFRCLLLKVCSEDQEYQHHQGAC